MLYPCLSSHRRLFHPLLAFSIDHPAVSGQLLASCIHISLVLSSLILRRKATPSLPLSVCLSVCLCLSLSLSHTPSLFLSRYSSLSVTLSLSLSPSVCLPPSLSPPLCPFPAVHFVVNENQMSYEKKGEGWGGEEKPPPGGTTLLPYQRGHGSLVVCSVSVSCRRVGSCSLSQPRCV